MNLQELRIGNWVDFPRITEKGAISTYCKIKSIADVGGHVEQHPERYLYHIDWLKPIPLDEEWLLKLGFELDHTMQTFQTETYVLKDFEIEYDSMLRELKYNRNLLKSVHQLQNL